MWFDPTNQAGNVTIMLQAGGGRQCGSPDAQINQKLRCDFAGVGAGALHPAVLCRNLVRRLQCVLHLQD